MAYVTIINGTVIDSTELDAVEATENQKRILAHARGDVHVDMSVERKVQRVLKNREAAASGNPFAKLVKKEARS